MKRMSIYVTQNHPHLSPLRPAAHHPPQRRMQLLTETKRQQALYSMRPAQDFGGRRHLLYLPYQPQESPGPSADGGPGNRTDGAAAVHSEMAPQRCVLRTYFRDARYPALHCLCDGHAVAEYGADGAGDFRPGCGAGGSSVGGRRELSQPHPPRRCYNRFTTISGRI